MLRIGRNVGRKENFVGAAPLFVLKRRRCVDRIARHSYGVWPEVGRDLLGPFPPALDHHGPRDLLETSDPGFGFSILMMGVDSSHSDDGRRLQRMKNSVRLRDSSLSTCAPS